MGVANDAGASADLRSDCHVHTAFAGGRDAVNVMVTAAERAGLRELTFADQASAATQWLPAYQSAIHRAQARTDVHLRLAIEVEVVRADGWLDFPTDLSGLELVSVAVSQVPLRTGPAGPAEIREALRGGRLRPTDVVDAMVTATVTGIERASRYAPAQVARLFSILGQVGIDTDELDNGLVAALAGVCRATGAAVELSEVWRAPSLRLAYRLAGAGVRLVAASDAGTAGQLGHWAYVPQVQAMLRQSAVDS